MSPVYDLTVRSEEPIPEDVLVEHVAVAMRDLQFTGKVDVQVARQHPFDGPEVFDDEPKPRVGHQAPAERIYTKAEVEAMGTVDVLKRLAEENNNRVAEALAQIIHKKGTYVEGGFVPLDPYPNVTEAAMQLREARKDER